MKREKLSEEKIILCVSSGNAGKRNVIFRENRLVSASCAWRLQQQRVEYVQHNYRHIVSHVTGIFVRFLSQTELRIVGEILQSALDANPNQGCVFRFHLHRSQ